MCACGHDETWHLANVKNPRVRGQCNYGHGSAAGGCRCAVFHTRGSKARAPSLYRPGAPAPTIAPVTAAQLVELVALASKLAGDVDELRAYLASLVEGEVTRAVTRPNGGGLTLVELGDPLAGVRGVLEEDDDDEHGHNITPRKARELLAAIDVGTTASSAPKKIGGGERKILEALAMHPDGCDRKRLGILTSYKTRGGRFGNLIGALRSAGWLYEPHHGIYAITPAGLAMVPDARPLPTGDDLYEHYFSHHKKIGTAERKAMTALRNAYPHAMTTTDLAAACNYDARGGRWSNILGRLRSLQIIEGKRSPVRLAKELVSS